MLNGTSFGSASFPGLVVGRKTSKGPIQIRAGGIVGAISNAHTASLEPRIVGWLKAQEARQRTRQTQQAQNPERDPAAPSPFAFSVSNVAVGVSIAESSARYVIDVLHKRGWITKSGRGVYMWVGDLDSAVGLDPPASPSKD